MLQVPSCGTFTYCVYYTVYVFCLNDEEAKFCILRILKCSCEGREPEREEQEGQISPVSCFWLTFGMPVLGRSIPVIVLFCKSADRTGEKDLF